ncbi:MAG: DNRLRE domain-containing protein [Polyangiaceae bacterium]
MRAVLCARGPEDARPEASALGQAARGSTVLLLRYAPRWSDAAEVEAAFLVLEPLAGAPPVQGPVRVELARVLEPWSAESATWARQPRLGLPALAATLRSAPPGPLRLEVTHIVRGWAKRPRGEHGIAVLASGEDPFGAVFTSGRSDGQPPRLEVYLR